MQPIKKFSFVLAAALASYGLLRYSTEVSSAVSDSVYRCLTVIIPSLFAFMIAAALLARSGVCEFAGRLFDAPARLLFGLEGTAFAIFLLSQIGGYPVGVTMLGELKARGRITAAQADGYSAFCFGCGPAFVSAFVSDSQLRSKMFISIFLSNAAVMFICCRFSKQKTKKSDCGQALFMPDIVSCVEAASRSMLKICAMIIAVSAALGLIDACGLGEAVLEKASTSIPLESSELRAILRSSAEVSNVFGVSDTALMCGLLSFGGICVFLQIASISGSSVSMPRFILCRFFCAILSVLLFRVLFSEDASAAVIPAYNEIKPAAVNVSIIESVFLVIMTMLLLSKKCGQNDKTVV